MSVLPCSICSHDNRDGSFFCSECGSKLHFSAMPQCMLVLVNGGSGSAAYQIPNRVSYIGRDASNDVVLPEEAVSKKHAKITFSKGVFYLEDLESSNGTFVNGERVSGRMTIKNGDVLRLGGAIVRFKCA